MAEKGYLGVQAFLKKKAEKIIEASPSAGSAATFESLTGAKIITDNSPSPSLLPSMTSANAAVPTPTNNSTTASSLTSDLTHP